MPFLMIERAEITRIENGELLRHTERDDLVGGMMEGIPTHPVDLLAQTVPSAVEAAAPSRPGFRAAPLFLELGQPFGAPLLDGSQAPTRHGEGLWAIGDHAKVNDADIEAASLFGHRGLRIVEDAGHRQKDLAIAQLRLDHRPGR
jgi:hypothetical protein